MKIEIEIVTGGVLVRRGPGGAWDSRIKSGPGSMYPHAAHRILDLVREHGTDNVAEAMTKLDIYPPMMDAADALQVEDWILAD